MSNNLFKYAILLAIIIAGILFFVDFESSFEGDIREANDLAKTWLFNNIREKGLFIYSANPVEDRISVKNNAIRQLMASRVLAQESKKNKELWGLHQLNLNFLFEFWYQEDDDVGFVFYNNKSKLGANAMLLRTLVYSPFFTQYEEEATALAKGILSLQNEDGSFRAWYKEPSYEYDEERLLTFYSGEALLALVEYHEKVGGEEWLDAAKLSADFYIDRYVTHLDENYYPAYVPWHTLALNKLYKITDDVEYADAIFTMNDKLLELLDTDQFRGRFYNPETPEYGSPHASSDAVYTEGLAYAYEIARLLGDGEREKIYFNALKHAVYNLGTLQYRKPSDQIEIDSIRYVGSIRTRADSFWIRVDATQHTIDAYTKLLEVL